MPVTTRLERARRRLARAEEELRELRAEAAAQQERWGYRIRRGRVTFQRDARLAQQRFKQGLRAFLVEGSLANLLTTPIIYSLLIPLVLLDVWVTAYQWLCFPIYGIARVRRREYFALDRHRLAYLNAIEKVNCTYCSYANGLIAYVREIAARTEQYWCPIKHADVVPDAHSRYHEFAEYGDAAGYRQTLGPLRKALRNAPETHEADRHTSKGNGGRTAAHQ